MILLLIYFSQLIFSPFHFETAKAGISECEVVQFYEIITPDQGTKVLTKSGEVREATFILKPVRIDEGSYEVEITRKAPNLYQINQAKDFKLTRYCIETQYCHEFANYAKATFVVTGNFEIVRGKLSFN